MPPKIFRKVVDVNKELWLLFSLFVIAAVFNFVLASHRVLLGFYGPPCSPPIFMAAVMPC